MKPVIEKYLARRADTSPRPFVHGELDGIDCVVVIPALAEESTLPETLRSIAQNPRETLDRTLAIVVVNNRPAAVVGSEVVEENLRTLAWLADCVAKPGRLGMAGLRLAWIDACTPGNELPAKEGVGLARKLGMDRALRILAERNGDRGVIVSLDADTLVESNYLQAIQDHFENSESWGAVVEYAHPLDGPSRQRDAVVHYELFLRYHVLGLQHAGSPYAFHTIGSTMACTPEAYAAVSGMRRRQGAEDFYFLQELSKTGRVDKIRFTTVHPSSRPSWRVPFGTGQRMQAWLDGDAPEYRVYNPETYVILRRWFDTVWRKVDNDSDVLLRHAGTISESLAAHLQRLDFESKWTSLREHAANDAQVLRQFHRWFDGLRTLQCIHHLRDTGLEDRDTVPAVIDLVQRMDRVPEPSADAEDLSEPVALLHYLRTIA